MKFVGLKGSPIYVIIYVKGELTDEFGQVHICILLKIIYLAHIGSHIWSLFLKLTRNMV